MLCHLQSVSSDHIVFNEYKKVILKLQQPVQYHHLTSSIAKHGFCLYLQFLSDSIAQSSETSLLFPVYNLTTTLLDCMQTEGNAACCETGSIPLSQYSTWMLNKPGMSFMQPMKVCLPWLNSYRWHTQQYAGLWFYLSSYGKLVDLCVCILFVCYLKLKVSCMVVFRDKGTFEPATGMLIRESRTNPLTWEFMRFYPTWYFLK